MGEEEEETSTALSSEPELRSDVEIEDEPMSPAHHDSSPAHDETGSLSPALGEPICTATTHASGLEPVPVCGSSSQKLYPGAQIGTRTGALSLHSLTTNTD